MDQKTFLNYVIKNDFENLKTNLENGFNPNLEECLY